MTAANAAYVPQVDTCYTGAQVPRKYRVLRSVECHIAEKQGRVKAMPEGPLKAATQALETLKARLRAWVEYPFG